MGTLGRIRSRLVRLLRGRGGRRHGLVGPQALWRMKRTFQIRFLTEQGLEPDHHLMDLGCGTLRGGLPLIEYLGSGRYAGLEVRGEVLDEAMRELRTAGLEHKAPLLLRSDDLGALSMDRSFDFIWAFSVLIHMEDDILRGAMRFAARHLVQGGVFYANVNVGDRPGAGWQGFPVMWRPLAFYEECARSVGLTVEDLGPLSELGHSSGDPAQDAQRMLKIARAGSGSGQVREDVVAEQLSHEEHRDRIDDGTGQRERAERGDSDPA